MDYCLAQDLPTLVWAANLADLELHTSLARKRDVARPTMMVFDLDPGAPADIVQCCQVGLWLRGLLTRMKLKSFAKTSGSKGLQVYVPLVLAKLFNFILVSRPRSHSPTWQHWTMSAGAPGSRSNTIMVGRATSRLRASEVCNSRSARFAAQTSVGKSWARRSEERRV